MLSMEALSPTEIDELWELAKTHFQAYSRDDFERALRDVNAAAYLRVAVEVKRVDVSTPTTYFSMERFG